MSHVCYDVRLYWHEATRKQYGMDRSFSLLLFVDPVKFRITVHVSSFYSLSREIKQLYHLGSNFEGEEV